RRRAERKMRADRREEDEERRPRRLRYFERVEAIERELIGNREPPELRAAIRQLRGAVDAIEAVEPAFRPRLAKARHQGDGAEAGPAERRCELVGVWRHQQRVGVGVADLDARQQTEMGEPRAAAEGR